MDTALILNQKMQMTNILTLAGSYFTYLPLCLVDLGETKAYYQDPRCKPF